LDLAIGNEQESLDEIHLEHISKRINLPVSQISNALNLLQRLDVVTQVDLREPRVGIHFIVNTDYLLEFIDESEPDKGNFLDALFRQFGPQVFSEIQYLDIEYLSQKLETTSNQLYKALQVFAEHDQILNFKWQEETKLIQVKDARTKKLRIDSDRAYNYRDILLKKIDYMARYASTNACREVFLRHYFGEMDCEPCGNCDNCSSSKKQNTLVNEKDIRLVIETLESGQKSIKQISESTNWNRKKTHRILSFMVRENFLKSDESGENYSLLSKT
jgi:ATP-dependent DNA helicase RecQ